MSIASSVHALWNGCWCAFLCASRITAAAQRRLRYITEECDDVDLSNHLQLPDALIDLASYNYEHLIQRSLMLLDRYYTSKSDIFAKAIPAQLLITSESVDFFKAIEERLFLDLLSFLKPGSGSEDTEATRSSSVVRELTEYCWLMDEVEGYEPHHINRNIILSFGNFSLHEYGSVGCESFQLRFGSI